MGNRLIERSVARALYGRFSREWRAERRLQRTMRPSSEGTARVSASPPLGRRPTFRQWHEMHERNQEMMRQSTPADVQEFMATPDYTVTDPWLDEAQSIDPNVLNELTDGTSTDHAE